MFLETVQALSGVIEEHRLEHRRGESGRISRPFGLKGTDRRGRVDRGTYPNRYNNHSKSSLTRTDNHEVYYCFTCLTDRLHRKNICTHCKQAGLIPKLSRVQRQFDSAQPVNMAEHAELLRSAARGLSELSQHSSDEDEDEMSYQGSMPSTLGGLSSPYDSQPDQSSSESQRSNSSHHTYTMDSAGDVVKRLTELSKQEQSSAQMDSACSLSNSGELVFSDIQHGHSM
ncbi:unnamed protein product [Echinostoma caproni]|uniref:FYVE_2 domain-containing protein n=1 Tax=Echinostoma caproni TaxID=27848 RepID=A0A183AQQ7_9TREM|nr:unnamed protein product [Echinostoma caproni]